jgi:hypothetical protein
MKAELGVDDWVVRMIENGCSIHQHVTWHVMGILRLKYGTPQGYRQAVLPDALKKYGPDLFQTMHNIITEVEESRQTCTIAITWDDQTGAPKLKVIRRLIIDPTAN